MRSRCEPATVVLFCVLAAAVVGTGCRGEVANEPATDQTETMDPEQDQSATLTGCLEQGKIPGTFVLTSASALDAPQAIGTGGTESEDSTERTFALVNLGDTDLTRHVGWEVTVEGRFQTEENEPPTLERAPELPERQGAQPDTCELIVESVERADQRCR